MFVISEIFPQHGGDINRAEQMILQSKIAGADAVKVQLYTATQFGKERAYLELNFEGLKRLKEYGDRVGIDVFGTPFTEERLAWCMELDLKYLKVPARMHQENPELVEKIINMKKPTFISVPSDYDLKKITIYDNATYLFCVVKYPTRVDERSMPDFENSIFSGTFDHTLGIAGALYAAAHGAEYLEKHFTIQHSFQYETEQAHLGSMTMNELAMLKNTAKEFKTIISGLGTR